MKRRASLLSAPLLVAFVGCQSIGRLPGIDPTDYAYTDYKCNVTQVYPQAVPQVQSSVLEAMADLGYTKIQCEPKAELVTIRARTVDGRPARITIQPRNLMSSLTVKIGAAGDEMVAQALIQRVALNFGALPRTIIPLEPTLSQRIDPLTPRRLVVPSPPDDSIPRAVPASPGPFAPSNAEDAEPNPRPAMANPRRRVR